MTPFALQSFCNMHTTKLFFFTFFQIGNSDMLFGNKLLVDNF